MTPDEPLQPQDLVITLLGTYVRPFEPAVLGDLVPHHGPGAGTGGQAPEREDPPIALDQEPLAPRGQAVVDRAAGAHARDQVTAHEPSQRGPRRAVGEAKFPQEHDQAAGPHRPRERAHVGSEQRNDQVLGLERIV